jgi:hypothetical protein
MLTQTDALSSPQEPVIVGEVDVEAQLLSDARQGDREAIGELRKLTEKKQLELPVAGVGVGSAPQTAPDQDENHPALAQVSRYLALGRGYSAIKHPSAALLVDVRVALSSPDAVQEGMDFALEHLGSHGADLIYDVYLDHLGQAGMTPVVARAMKEVNSKRLFELATPALQVALRLANSKACAEYRLIIPDAAANGDDRSLQKLRALLSRRGCGTYGNKDCFVCLRSAEVPLEAAVQRAETHPSPVFLTPAEEARESVPNATADE